MTGFTCPNCGQLYSAGGHAHVCPPNKFNTFPRVTEADVDAAISCAYTFNAWDAVTSDSAHALNAPEELKRLTIAVVVLKNGYVVTGESACAHIANYDQAIGVRLATRDAKAKIWPLMGYALKDQLARAAL